MEASNGPEALELIMENNIDLVFLDIQMPGMNGFEVLETVGPESMPAVVFVTAYDKYAIAAFDVQAIDYLLKPYNRDRFSKAFRNACSRINSSTIQETELKNLISSITQDQEYINRLVVNQNGRFIFVTVDKILYFSAEDKYVTIHTNKEKYLIRDTMKRLESRLNPNEFTRIHRSYIVCLHAIKEIQNWFQGEYKAILVNGEQLPVSRRYRSRLLDID